MTSGAVDLPVYDFGPFRLDPAERLLVRDGQPVPLTPKVFDLLVYLVERHGRLVEKQALLSALWPDAIVEEANLAYNVSALRKVLDNEVEGFSMIQTVPTRGYRFTQRVVATRVTAEPVLLPASADADSTVFVPTVADGRRSWRSLSEWISTVVGVRVRDSIWMLATLAAASIALFATRFAVESPAERGEPTELMLNEQPVSIRNVSSPALSPDGQRIAFLGSVPGHRDRTWVRKLNSTRYESLDGDSTLFWSPDSRFLGYVDGHVLKKVEVGAGPSQVIYELPAGVDAFCDAQGVHPALSGATWNAKDDILFGLGDKVNGPIYRVVASGGTARALTQLDHRLGEIRHVFPSFLPDGRHFLYTAIGTRRALMAGALDSQEHVLVKDIDAPAVYAAPGFLIFTRENRVVAQRFDPVHLTVAGNEMPLQTARPCLALSVSAMGTLVCETRREGRTHGEITASNSRLAWFDRAGHELESITPPGGYALPRLSPDGTRALVERFDDTNQGDLWIFDVRRHAGYRVTDDPGRDSDAVWSPTGDRVAFTREVETSGSVQCW